MHLQYRSMMLCLASGHIYGLADNVPKPARVIVLKLKGCYSLRLWHHNCVAMV
jgi:hypothetical protein